MKAYSRPQGRVITVTAVLTAVVTFVATQTAGWLYSRTADQIADGFTTSIGVRSYGASIDAGAVMLPQSEKDLEGQRIQDDRLLQWAINRGGGPSDRVSVSLEIWGRKDEPVRLNGVQAKDVVCEPAPEWTAVRATGAGDVPPRTVLVDLSSQDHEGTPIRDPVTDEVFAFPLQVSRDSLEIITVIVQTDESCLFRLEVLFGPLDDPQTYTVDDDGEPFRVISSSAAAAEMEWTWQESDGDFLVLRGDH